MQVDIRPTPTEALNSFVAQAGMNQVSLKWGLPFPENGYRAAEVWVNTVNDRETATRAAVVAGNTYNYLTNDVTNTQYFWIRAVNEFGRADGLWAGPVSAQAFTVEPGEFNGTIDLATQVTGQLALGNITGLGALAILDTVGVAKVTGLGNLATQNTVNANTQVTNLGDLAYADTIAANVIGAGTLGVGVVYAGTINADNITSGTVTGRHYRTSSATTRLAINESSNNALKVYISGTEMASVGGSSPSVAQIMAKSGSSGYAAISGTHSGSNSGISGSTTGSGYGGLFSGVSSSIAAVGAVNASGRALYVQGYYEQEPYAESANRSTRTNNCIPVEDNTYNCGTLARRWMGMTSATALVVSSDVRTKTDIIDSSLGLSFINKLRPVSYRLLVGRNEITKVEHEGPYPPGMPAESGTIVTPVAGTRHHYGLIAQDVKQAMDECGASDAAFWALANPADPESQQALRYEELIAPMIKAVQELSAKVATLEQQITMAQ